MSYMIRPARLLDADTLSDLSGSLSARGFLTLPAKPEELERLIAVSEQSFRGALKDPDQGRYVFVMEDMGKRRVIGCSLIVARHGTEDSPHLYFQVDEEKGTINFQSDPVGRTELGGLILDPAYRGKPAKLGKGLSLIRLLYIKRNPKLFKDDLLAEFLPPFTPDGKSHLWESLGRRLTGMGYREADEKSRRDKRFVLSLFPRGPILVSSLSEEAQMSIGVVGSETEGAVKMLKSVGFEYLRQIDPFDGGPHYGAKKDAVKYDVVEDFLFEQTEIKWMFTPS
ncbi:MAG TPA: arginine N-succinyltransferase [bacterium]|nr:arginine N-succinyltransferase [bacterium]